MCIYDFFHFCIFFFRAYKKLYIIHCTTRLRDPFQTRPKYHDDTVRVHPSTSSQRARRIRKRRTKKILALKKGSWYTICSFYNTYFLVVRIVSSGQKSRIGSHKPLCRTAFNEVIHIIYYIGVVSFGFYVGRKEMRIESKKKKKRKNRLCNHVVNAVVTGCTQEPCI